MHQSIMMFHSSGSHSILFNAGRMCLVNKLLLPIPLQVESVSENATCLWAKEKTVATLASQSMSVTPVAVAGAKHRKLECPGATTPFVSRRVGWG